MQAYESFRDQPFYHLFEKIWIFFNKRFKDFNNISGNFASEYEKETVSSGIDEIGIPLRNNLV